MPPNPPQPISTLKLVNDFCLQYVNLKLINTFEVGQWKEITINQHQCRQIQKLSVCLQKGKQNNGIKSQCGKYQNQAVQLYLPTNQIPSQSNISQQNQIQPSKKSPPKKKKRPLVEVRKNNQLKAQRWYEQPYSCLPSNQIKDKQIHEISNPLSARKSMNRSSVSPSKSKTKRPKQSTLYRGQLTISTNNKYQHQFNNMAQPQKYTPNNTNNGINNLSQAHCQTQPRISSFINEDSFAMETYHGQSTDQLMERRGQECQNGLMESICNYLRENSSPIKINKAIKDDCQCSNCSNQSQSSPFFSTRKNYSSPIRDQLERPTKSPQPQQPSEVATNQISLIDSFDTDRIQNFEENDGQQLCLSIQRPVIRKLIQKDYNAKNSSRKTKNPNDVSSDHTLIARPISFQNVPPTPNQLLTKLNIQSEPSRREPLQDISADQNHLGSNIHTIDPTRRSNCQLFSELPNKKQPLSYDMASLQRTGLSTQKDYNSTVFMKSNHQVINRQQCLSAKHRQRRLFVEPSHTQRTIRR